MDPDEAQILASAKQFAQRRDADAVVRLLDDEIDVVLRGARSRQFTGMAFDGYCRALLASAGHCDATFARVRRLCERSRQHFGEQPWTYLYEASLLHLDGQDEAAAELYALAAPGADILWGSSIGCRSVVAPRQRETYLSLASRQDALHWARSVQRSRPTLLVACDHEYLRRFAGPYLRSVRTHGGDCGIHIHLLNPHTDDFEWIEGQSGELWANLSLTTETYQDRDARAYFALCRMIHLREILARHQQTIFVTDIDAAFTEPLQPLSSTSSVALRFKHVNFHAHPWNTIHAGAMLVRPTPHGFEFAHALAAISVGHFAARAGAGVWFIDQNIVFSTYRHVGARNGVRVDDLSTLGLPGGLVFGKDL